METAPALTGGESDLPLHALWLLLFLVSVIGVAGLLLRRLRISYTVGLVVVGLVIAWFAHDRHLQSLAQVHLTENLIIYVFLPVLIFGASLTINTNLLKKNLIPILALALPGVVFATVFTGVLAHYLTPLTWSAAFLFGALISTTDPVAVIAAFKELGAPPRLDILVDGESLFNDAAAIVMFGVVSGLIAAGSMPTTGTLVIASFKFVAVFGGGFAVGWILGETAGLLNRWAKKLCDEKESAMFRGLFSLALAFCAFLLAQGLLEFSGVMAAVGAGISFAKNVKKHFGEAALKTDQTFWEMLVFLANGLIFLFLGMTEVYLFESHLRFATWSIATAVLIVTAARAALIYGGVPLINRLPRVKFISRRYQTMMFWGGLRGALPIGLALSLRASDFGMTDLIAADKLRQIVVMMTVAVVIFTLVVQGLTVAPLMRALKITTDSGETQAIAKSE